MKVVIQRVTAAKLTIDDAPGPSIGKGMVVLAGFEDSDSDEDLAWMCGKIIRLRIFDDDQQVMNLDVNAVHGELMVVSQFTLHASTRKGNRPSYVKAARPEKAVPLYDKFIQLLESALGKKIATGKFGANMQISLSNDGPVTIIIDSKTKE